MGGANGTTSKKPFPQNLRQLHRPGRGALSLLAPARAAGFVYGRNMYRSFAAGSTLDMDQNFRPRLRSGDADVKKAYKLVAARCRDQAENNSLISGAIDRVCNNVVRSGIYPKFKFRTAAGKLDREANTKWRQGFMRWSRYCDITGHGTYGGLQKLGLRHMWTDGQYLIHRVYDTSRPGICLLRLELLEFDQLDAMVDGRLANGSVARKGVLTMGSTSLSVLLILRQSDSAAVKKTNIKT